jgi:hypothetical protein
MMEWERGLGQDETAGPTGNLPEQKAPSCCCSDLNHRFNFIQAGLRFARQASLPSGPELSIVVRF